MLSHLSSALFRNFYEVGIELEYNRSLENDIEWLEAEGRQQREMHMECIKRFFRLLAMLLERLFEDLLFCCNFSEYPDKRRPPCSTMPWNIRPALIVLWGVCWMLYSSSTISQQDEEACVSRMAETLDINPIDSSHGNPFPLDFQLKHC